MNHQGIASGILIGSNVIIDFNIAGGGIKDVEQVRVRALPAPEQHVFHAAHEGHVDLILTTVGVDEQPGYGGSTYVVGNGAIVNDADLVRRSARGNAQTRNSTVLAQVYQRAIAAAGAKVNSQSVLLVFRIATGQRTDRTIFSDGHVELVPASSGRQVHSLHCARQHNSAVCVTGAQVYINRVHCTGDRGDTHVLGQIQVQAVRSCSRADSQSGQIRVDIQINSGIPGTQCQIYRRIYPVKRGQGAVNHQAHVVMTTAGSQGQTLGATIQSDAGNQAAITHVHIQRRLRGVSRGEEHIGVNIDHKVVGCSQQARTGQTQAFHIHPPGGRKRDAFTDIDSGVDGARAQIHIDGRRAAIKRRDVCINIQGHVIVTCTHGYRQAFERAVYIRIQCQVAIAQRRIE